MLYVLYSFKKFSYWLEENNILQTTNPRWFKQLSLFFMPVWKLSEFFNFVLPVSVLKTCIFFQILSLVTSPLPLRCKQVRFQHLGKKYIYLVLRHCSQAMFYIVRNTWSFCHHVLSTLEWRFLFLYLSSKTDSYAAFCNNAFISKGNVRVELNTTFKCKFSYLRMYKNVSAKQYRRKSSDWARFCRLNKDLY